MEGKWIAFMVACYLIFFGAVMIFGVPSDMRNACIKELAKAGRTVEDIKELCK